MSTEIASKYMFTVDLTFDPTQLGTFPDGRRIDLRYSGSAVTDPAAYQKSWGLDYAKIAKIDPEKPPPKYLLDAEWAGLEGEVVSGSDLASVRNDGVATFDGRLTLRVADGYLLNAQVSGLVDLFPVVADRRPTLEEYQKGIKYSGQKAEVGAVAIVLNLAFDGASSDNVWANAKYQQRTFFRYQRLLRGLFVAIGTGYLEDGIVTAAKLDVREIAHGKGDGAE
jgi:hypothetical protein